jgi:hypothetical protein
MGCTKYPSDSREICVADGGATMEACPSPAVFYGCRAWLEIRIVKGSLTHGTVDKSFNIKHIVDDAAHTDHRC